MQKSVAILCVVFVLSGCDTKKDERNSLRVRLEEKLSAVAQVEQIIRDVEAKQFNINTEIVTLKDALTKDESAINENKDSLASYVLDNKLAVMATAATGAGIAGVLADNLDDQVRGAAISAGVMGAAYCMFSEDECSTAAAKVAYFGTQISLHKDSAATYSDKISSLQKRFADLEEYKAPFLADRTVLSTGSDALTSQIDALACHGVFCF